MAERVALVNQFRESLAEYGIVMLQGRFQVRSKLPEILEDGEYTLPYLAREVFSDQCRRLCELDRVIGDYDQKISSLSKSQEVTRRKLEIEGVGPIAATAIVASAGDLHDFKNGCQFAA
ncbi:transposase [Marinomonas sp. CT5]|uniref:transposase n=1 Tax=Marinomonas sp. CT5 TaxID=2066133 RepID=UPI001BAFFCD6|nr:transposase [Marinomonas sp. CT5]